MDIETKFGMSAPGRPYTPEYHGHEHERSLR